VLLALFVSLGTLAAQPNPSQGTIEGQILNAATGAPLKKASVILTTVGAGGMVAPPAKQGAAGRPPQPNLTADTDAEGKYQFSGLPPGRYLVRAQKPGFLPQAYGVRRTGGTGMPISVSQDQHVKDAVIKMTPQAVLEGHVLDEDGDPVTQGFLMLFKQTYRDGKKQWSQVTGTGTNEAGEFRMTLQPGRYILSATNQRQLPNSRFGEDPAAAQKPDMVYAPTYYPNSPTEQGASPIDIAPGGNMRGIDIRVSKTAAYHVRGVVNGGTPAPAAGGRGGTQVIILPKSGIQNQQYNSSIQPDGTFDLRGVMPGQYTLFAHSPAPPTGQMMAMQLVTVGSNNLTGLVLNLVPPFDLVGQVAVAESGTQINRQNIHLTLRPHSPFFGNGGNMATTDDEGRFLIKGLSAGIFAIDVQNVPDGCFVKSVKYGGQEISDDGIEFNGPQPIEIVLSATAGKISGTVTDKDGNPLPSVTVALLPSVEGEHPTSLNSDYNGGFTFSHLRPGTYRLLAFEDVEAGAWQDPEFRKPYDSRAVEIKIGPGDNQTAQLKVIPVEDMVAK
jgi:protocatechuate 3,4-dioxygenase beta subunit